jgi:hypothetical protein
MIMDVSQAAFLPMRRESKIQPGKKMIPVTK